MLYDYLIIGGGIAGVTAAETIREGDAYASIAIVSSEPHVLYSRVLLPSYLKRRIPREKVFLRVTDDFTEKRIDLHLQMEAASVDARHREAVLENGMTLGYRKLLIASGGRVKEWGKPEDQSLIYRLQTLDDADRLFNALPHIRSPFVVGASFISLEFLEIFRLNHISPTLLVRDKRFFGDLLDDEGGRLFQENFEAKGIKVFYQDSVAEITHGLTGAEVTTRTLKKIPCDAIGVGIGIDRNLDFLKESGIETGEKGIRTNEFLEASQPDVFAAGDVAEYHDVISGAYRAEGNWTSAFLQGKQAGLNMAGQRAPFKSVPTYTLVNLGFQITVLGDCSDDENTIVRSDGMRRWYERFFLREGKLAGAVLINRFADKTHVARLIEGGVQIGQWHDALTDFAFDIHSIPVII